jgi:hypothetical protein
MRRRRIIREHSQLSLITSASVAALAGFAVGVLIMHKSGGLTPLLRSTGRKRLRGPGEADGPPDSVYEMDSFAHDESAYGSEEDDFEDDPEEDAIASEVEERVLAAFLNDPILADAPIEIGAAGDGIIELHGWVEEGRTVKHAATIAGGVPGVIGVSNSIRVRRPRRTQTS